MFDLVNVAGRPLQLRILNCQHEPIFVKCLSLNFLSAGSVKLSGYVCKFCL
jgi:hypothetical protein